MKVFFLVLIVGFQTLVACGKDASIRQSDEIQQPIVPPSETVEGQTSTSNPEEVSAIPSEAETINKSEQLNASPSNGIAPPPSESGTREIAPVPVIKSCEDMWTDYVVINSVGKMAKFHVVTLSKFGGRENKMESDSTQTITESSNAFVETEIATVLNGQLIKSKTKLTQEVFMEGCNKPIENSPQSVERGDESGVQVAAGKFDTKWTVIVTEQGTTKSRTKSWTVSFSNGDSVLVKSESATEMAQGSTETKMELIETNRNQ